MQAKSAVIIGGSDVLLLPKSPRRKACVVDVLKQMHERLGAKGVTVLGPPQQSPNGGQWFFFIKDCDGNLIELLTTDG